MPGQWYTLLAVLTQTRPGPPPAAAAVCEGGVLRAAVAGPVEGAGAAGRDAGAGCVCAGAWAAQGKQSVADVSRAASARWIFISVVTSCRRKCFRSENTLLPGFYVNRGPQHDIDRMQNEDSADRLPTFMGRRYHGWWVNHLGEAP